MLRKLILASTLGLILAGCSSSIKKADIAPTANPAEEVSRLDNEIKTAYGEHVDILAKKDLEKSESYLKEARTDLADGESQAEVLESVAYGQAHLNRANEKAKTGRAQIENVIAARQKALDAGARKYPPTQEQLTKLDDAVRDSSEHLDKMSAEETSSLQARYLVIELNAIKSQQLGKAAGHIDAAKKRKAAKYAPRALKQAETDFKTAENLIVANRNETDTYSAPVATATRSALLLTDILAATKGGDIDEATATKVVMQDRKIRGLETDLQAADKENQIMGTVVNNQGQTIRRAGAAISLQESLASAQKEFSNDEAEVFQQGNQLVIRLKSMNFASGRSEVPATAMPVLAKVKGVADELSAEQVRVEGHTDSTGTAAVNKDLSEARAESIKKYLETNGIAEDKIESVGYGFEKPIASNRSKAGRAQNRRVDIVITPTTASAAQPASTSTSDEM